MELGCINHALLTAEAIRRDGLELAGWVANSVTPEMDCYEDNLASLQQRLDCPLIAELPFLADNCVEQAATHVAIDQLLQ